VFNLFYPCVFEITDGFWQLNLLLLLCEALMDVFVLLNSIHSSWWSAIVFVVCCIGFYGVLFFLPFPQTNTMADHQA
jgi:TctA family transporter